MILASQMELPTLGRKRRARAPQPPQADATVGAHPPASAPQSELTPAEIDHVKRQWKRWRDHPDLQGVCAATAKWLAAQRHSEGDPERAKELRKHKPPLLEVIKSLISAWEQAREDEGPDEITEAEILDAHVHDALDCSVARWSRATRCAMCGSNDLVMRWSAARGAPVFYYTRTGATTGKIGYKDCNNCGTKHDLQCYTPGERWAQDQGLDPLAVGAVYLVLTHFCCFSTPMYIYVSRTAFFDKLHLLIGTLERGTKRAEPRLDIARCDAGKQRRLLPRDQQDPDYFMSSTASVWEYNLFIDFEAYRYAVPETTFEAYCLYFACTNGISDRSDAAHSAKGGAFAYTFRPCAPLHGRRKNAERFIPFRTTFAAAWRKSFICRILNEHLPDHPYASGSRVCCP